MRRSLSWARILLLAAMALVLVVPWTVLADNVEIVDGDDVSAGTLSLGDVCVGASVSTDIALAIKRNGNYPSTNVFTKNSTVTLSVTATSSRLTASMVSGKDTVTVPSNWDTVAQNTLASGAESTVTFAAGSTPGAFSGTVTYTAAGTSSKDGGALQRSGTLTVTANVIDCTPADTTPPDITPNISGTLGNNGWYVSDVTVSWTVTDDESAITSDACPTTTITSDTIGQTVSCSATSAGGTATKSVTIKRDATKPTFGGCPSGGPFILGSGTHTVGPISADDATSGLDEANSTLSGTVDAGSIGSKSVTFTAVDYAGNEATKTCTYQVIYDWHGFFQPVDNLPALNKAKAGSAIPVKFSLSGDQGLNIFAAGYPRSVTITCGSTANADAIEEIVTAGQSSLNYDPIADQYIYVWKTDKAWAGTCRQLVVMLADGMTYRANFNFVK